MNSILRMTNVAAALSGALVILSGLGHGGEDPENLASLELELKKELSDSPVYKVFPEQLVKKFQLVLCWVFFWH